MNRKDVVVMLELIKNRLKSFGYEPKEGDDFAILFAMEKTENTMP